MQFKIEKGVAVLREEKLKILVVKYVKVCSGTDPETGQDIYVDCLTANGTYRMNSGEMAATKMDGGVRIFEASGASYMPIVRDFYNVNHTNIPIIDAKAISVQQGADALNHWQRKGELVDAINACTTVEEVQAIDISFNVNVV